MNVFHSFDSNDKDITELKAGLAKEHDTVLTAGVSGSWPGMLDYVIHCCRSAQKLRRKLVTPLADFDILCRLLLQVNSYFRSCRKMLTLQTLFKNGIPT